MNRQELLGRIEARWQALLASCAGLTDAEMLAPGVVGAWSIKDVIGHVSVWEEEALTHLPAVLAGRRPPRYSTTHGGIDAFNARMTERNRALTLAQVLQRRDDTHRRLVEFVAQVPEAAYAGDTKFRRRLRLDTYGHYAVHTRAILKWRAAHRSALA